jgi:hypothetical protein
MADPQFPDPTMQTFSLIVEVDGEVNDAFPWHIVDKKGSIV